MIYSKDIKEKAFEYSNACIDCKLCMKNCPMLDEFCSSPRELLKTISSGKDISVSLPYSCTLCSYCSSVCPKGVSFEDVFYNMRTEAVSSGEMESKTVSKGISIVSNHQKLSFSKHFTSLSGSKGAKNFKVGFMPGCSLVSYRPDLISKIHDYLSLHFESPGVILKCCGKPTSAVGDVEKFKEYYSDFEKSVEDCGCEIIITACPNCYRTISKNSPHIRIVSLWEIVEQKGLPHGHVDIDALNPGSKAPVFSIHDPCPSRNISSIHEAVRNICRDMGVDACEFESSRAHAPCCGQGGMVGLTSPHISQKQKNKRAGESGSDYILVYCQACAESMQSAGAKTVHILDLLFPKENVSSDLNQVRPGFIGKWINRYRGKRICKKL